MKIALRILAFTAMVGGGFWMWHSPKEVEPYVTSVTLLAGFLATFAGGKSASAEKEAPDIVAYLLEIGRLQHRLVIENRGPSSAFDVKLDLHLAEGQQSPLMHGDDTFPIRELYSHDERQILVALSFDTGAEFDATWSWKNAKGRKFERRNTVSIRK